MTRPSLAVSVLVSVLLLSGCPAEAPSAPAAPAAPAPAAAADAATPTATSGGGSAHGAANEWCGEHGVPEAVCTRCNTSLIESFKAKKDWCAEHGLPESQCITCNPEVEAKWKALAPR